MHIVNVSTYQHILEIPLALFLPGLFGSGNQVQYFIAMSARGKFNCPCREEHMAAGAIVVGAIKIYIRPYLLVIDMSRIRGI